VRWPLVDVRLFNTALFACSKSGSARIRFGDFFFRDFDFGIGDGLLHRRQQPSRPFIPAALIVINAQAGRRS
jgi:hypothetical protein